MTLPTALSSWLGNQTQGSKKPVLPALQPAGRDAQDRAARAGQEGPLEAARPWAAVVACPVCNPQPPAESRLHFWLLVSDQK